MAYEAAIAAAALVQSKENKPVTEKIIGRFEQDAKRYE